MKCMMKEFAGILLLQGQNPCDGCNEDRDICRGQPKKIENKINGRLSRGLKEALLDNRYSDSRKKWMIEVEIGKKGLKTFIKENPTFFSKEN